MGLCDNLEKEQTNNNKAHETLVEVLLTTLTDAKNSDDFKEAWQRIAACFDTLFTTEHSIDKVKQTILQLAVMDKLVSQDPNDEPASELLKRIAKEKVRLVKEGEIKKQAALPEINEVEKPFELPKGWEWVRLLTLVHLLGDGLHGTPEYTNNYAEKMTGDYVNPEQRERELRNRAQRKVSWENKQWRISRNENHFLNYENHHLLIFRDRYSGKFKLKIDDLYGKKTYDEIENAKIAAFKNVEYLKEKGKW